MSAVPQPTPDDASGLPEIPAGIRRSMEVYWRDLPQLLPLKSRKRRWVAYHGEERIGFGRTQLEAYLECQRRGLRIDEIYIGILEQDEVPPWEPEEIDGFGEGPDDDDEPTGEFSA